MDILLHSNILRTKFHNSHGSNLTQCQCVNHVTPDQETRKRGQTDCLPFLSYECNVSWSRSCKPSTWAWIHIMVRVTLCWWSIIYTMKYTRAVKLISKGALTFLPPANGGLLNCEWLLVKTGFSWTFPYETPLNWATNLLLYEFVVDHIESYDIFLWILHGSVNQFPIRCSRLFCALKATALG